MDHQHNTNTTNTSPSSSWDLDMTMANPLLLGHTPYEFLGLNPNPLDHFHHHHHPPFQSNAQFTNTTQQDTIQQHKADKVDKEEGQLGAMKEMMYRIAAMQPVDIDPSMIKKPKRRNVRISDDPQSIAARHRRERISERIRILQQLVPGGTKMDTASMLDEAIRYVKFLKRQVEELQANPPPTPHQVGVIGDLAAPSEIGGDSLGLGFGFSTGDGPSDRMGRYIGKF